MNTTYEMVQSAKEYMVQLQFDYWMHHVVFTFDWWFMVVASVIGWVIWWKLVDRTQIQELVMYGALILIVTTILDGAGVEMRIWDYPVQVVPTYSRFIPVDFAALPISCMLLYQYFRTWRSFTIASCFLALFYAFVLEPLVVWMGIYDPIHWRHIYSFPIYIAITTGVRWIVKRLWNIQPELNETG